MSVTGFDINGTITKYDYGSLDNVPIVLGVGTDSVVVVNETTPNTASGDYAFAGGSKSSSVNYGTTASGIAAFAFGQSVQAQGNRSVALGERTLASGAASFAMGNQSEASGLCSAAIGQIAAAQAPVSAAIGDRITSTGRACLVIGAFNELDANAEDSSHGTGARKYLFIVGNGTADDARSNAMTVDWDGNGGGSTVMTEETVTTDGAVTKALSVNTICHFTGELTSLTITLTATTNLAQYHFDFLSGATAPTLTMPNTVTMPDGFSVNANRHYEISILNNLASVNSWEIPVVSE